MGGVPKGTLPSPDGPEETLVARAARIGRAAGLREVLLVGRAEAYGGLGLPSIADRPGIEGPLAGLAAMVDRGGGSFVLLACDMPAVDEALLAKVREGSDRAAVLAPRAPDGRWQPLCAWYAPTRVRPGLERALRAGVRSFQRLFDALSCEVLALGDEERARLEDWDRPEEVRARGPAPTRR
jgi:molybdopterin-guanine dinucleotide biosynthesis protein A